VKPVDDSKDVDKSVKPVDDSKDVDKSVKPVKDVVDDGVSVGKDIDTGKVIVKDEPEEPIEDEPVVRDEPLFGSIEVIQMRFGLDGSNPGPLEYIEQARISANNYIKSWCVGHCIKIPLYSAIPGDLRVILDDLAESESLFFLFSDSESYSGGTNTKANAYKKMVDNSLNLLLNWFNQDCNGGAVSPYTITTSNKFKHQSDYSYCVKSTNRSFVGRCSSFHDG
jgi:hypothetical protein